MISYSLKCAKGHDFESWFGSAEAFDRLKGAGRLSCAVCGDTSVDKALMAPRVVSRSAEHPLSGPASVAEQAMAELRRRIEAESDDVGRDFPGEARRIHEGEAPKRSIIGEANWTEARELIEEGIAVAPLPWSRPGRKTD